MNVVDPVAAEPSSPAASRTEAPADAARPAPRRRGRGRRLALIAALPLGFLLAEAALRLAGGDVAAPEVSGFAPTLVAFDGRPLVPLSGPLKMELAPFTQWRLAPNQSTPDFTVNDRGYRGPPIGAERGDRRRVVLLGASTTFGMGISGDARTISGRLGELLPDWEVINAGVPWFFSGQELAQLATEALDLHPDAVIAIDGWTDLFDWWSLPPRTREPFGCNRVVLRMNEARLLERQERTEAPGALLGEAWSAAVARSRVVAAVRRRLAPDLPAAFVPNDSPYAARPEDAADAKAEAWARTVDRYVENVARMRDLCAARGAIFFAALQPELGAKARRTSDEERILREGFAGTATYADAFPAFYRKFRVEVAARCAARGIETVDLAEIPGIRDAAGPRFLDVVHPDPAGAREIAVALSARLRAGAASRPR
ncbi:MAG TPA: hypothetical protein VEI02_12495 [Planctomycetota bacterium]|nr:hypothetical protein [Planctomycetota bacterium]